MAQVIADDLGPDIVMPEGEEETKKVSTRRDARKQQGAKRAGCEGK